MPCLWKQCWSRSASFWRSQLIWICTVCHLVCGFVSITWIKLSDWLKIRRGHGILIYSAWQGLRATSVEIWRLRLILSDQRLFGSSKDGILMKLSYNDSRDSISAWIFFCGVIFFHITGFQKYPSNFLINHVFNLPCGLWKEPRNFIFEY